MSQKITPALKGLITGLLMLAVALFLYYTKQPFDSGLQYLVYIIYAAGIVWTLISYRKSVATNPKFGELFGQGFRCFIVVTLVMVAFTGFFSAAHPEFAKEAAQHYKEELLKEKKGNRNPVEINEMVAKAEKQYTVQLISASIFGYLIIGAIVTAGCSALLIARKQ